MYTQQPLLTPFFQTRWLPFRLYASTSPPEPLVPMQISSGMHGALVKNDTELDFDAFTLELSACEEEGDTNEAVVAFTGPRKMLMTALGGGGLDYYYGLCSTDPIALTVLPEGLEAGDTCGVRDGAMSAEGNGFVFLCYTGQGLGLVRRAGSGQTWYVGKVINATIESEACGEVEQHIYDGGAWVASGVTFDVYNPHGLDFPVDFKMRWTKYPGWTGCGTCATDWICEPWHFTEC